MIRYLPRQESKKEKKRENGLPSGERGLDAARGPYLSSPANHDRALWLDGGVDGGTRL